MPLGPKPNLHALATALNPGLLRLFVRDLLGERGYREVREFDGPGDGGRDLEAIDPTGEPCVLQLKYRESPEATTSTTEFAELPSALLRLGRKKGLFVTNGRISAPAKRDATNAFPSFSMRFMEGVDLLAALDAAPLTAALWLSGSGFHHLARRASFGVICRSFPSDRGRFLDELPGEVTEINWKAVLRDESLTVVCGSRNRFSYSDFEPFRPPRNITTSQGWLGSLYATEVTIHGSWGLDQLTTIQETLGRECAARWSAIEGPLGICAIRVGCASVSADGVTHSSKEGPRPQTWLGRAGEAAPEGDAIGASLGIWRKPSWIQTYQASCGLYYLLWSDEEILCSLRYRSMTSRSELGMALAKRAHFEHWWERSVCCILPVRVATDDEVDDVMAPHHCHAVAEGRWIAVWLHPRLQGIMSEPQLAGDRRDGDYDPLSEHEREKSYIEAAWARARDVGGEAIKPHVAYHGLCFATGGEAAPSVMWRTHSTGELLDYPGDIPSPIDLFDVQCEYMVAYIVENPERARQFVASCQESVDAEWSIHAIQSADFDDARLSFLTGTVDRGLDERLVLLVFARHASSRTLLATRLEQDASSLLSLLNRVEQMALFSKELRGSRRWLRERWRVYFAPEHPAVGDEQVMLDAEGRPLPNFECTGSTEGRNGPG